MALRRIGYSLVRQSGDHIGLSTYEGGQHHVTIPDRRPLRLRTLNAVLRDIGRYRGMTREQLLARLFDSRVAPCSEAHRHGCGHELP